MNKNLFRLAGTILAFEAIGIFVLYFSAILFSFNRPVLMVWFAAALLPTLVPSVGLLLLKKWSVGALWASLAFSFAVSVFFEHSYPSFVSSVPGGFQVWGIDLIIAIFLTLDWRKSKLL